MKLSHKRRRGLRLENLESRRLMVAEGTPFDLSLPVETAGLVGNASARVDWGDGTTTNGTVIGGNQVGRVKIQFDYSLDTNRFFGTSANDPFRVQLQIAADALVSRFNDNLTAVAPAQFVTVRPRIFHPSLGPANSATGNVVPLPENPTIPADTIIIFAGGRNLPGGVRGVGGGASISFSRTCIPGPQCDQAQANQDAIQGRGQPGALASPATDIAPMFGSISFDTGTRNQFYLGDDPDGISPNQIDFQSVATHELAHALGFGTSESWNNLASTGSFTGEAARAAFVGDGDVPLVPGHWAPSVVAGQPTLQGASIEFGVRVPFSKLDFAAMDDIGWDVMNTSATVTASHRYADDGNFPVGVTLSGSRGGQLEFTGPTVNVTNVAPTLTPIGAQSVALGSAVSLANIGTFTDPGFQSETFDFSINWGDGVIDTGTATIDTAGNASGRLTSGSFDGSHTYETPGPKTVTLRVTDDDGGFDQETFVIDVMPAPSLSLSLSAAAITENQTAAASTLTVSRSGPARTSAQTIQLSSSDTTEATVPATVVIPAGATSASVLVAGVDDQLLDGAQTVTLAASGDGLESGQTSLTVNDSETLTASISGGPLSEGGDQTVMLRVIRSNTDNDAALSVTVTGPGLADLTFENPIVIPPGSSQVTIPVTATDDDRAELTEQAELVFAASGYVGTTASIEVADNEPPLFQNPVDRFDVNNMDGVSAFDALRVINRLAIRRDNPLLDPETETPGGDFFDVNGDYMVTATDALQIINELARRRVSGGPSGEQIDAVFGSNLAQTDWRVDDPFERERLF